MQRLEGMAKLTGREAYVDDRAPSDTWWGMTVRSPAPRGRVRSIDFGAGVDWSTITVVDHRDIPGPNEVRLIELDQPVLAADRVRHVHEPVVLLAHPCRDTVRRAARAVRVVIDEEEPALDFRVPPTAAQIQHGDDNVLKAIEIAKGDVERALADAPHVIEAQYETGAQEHVYIEPNGMEAWIDGDVLTVVGSMQCPYYVLNALVHALDRSPEQVRVIQAPTGGGFGGKEDFPSVLALHAALLAIKSGQRVRMIYDRGEDMAATTKRHPALVRHRTAVDERGRLLAQDIEVVMDGGAYVTLSPVVLSRGLIHAAGPYSCDNVRVAGRSVLTNSVPYGAFRGFGAPQTQFAGERHMDLIARRLGIDPVVLRRRNLIRNGQTTSTGQVIDDGVDREEVLDAALDLSRYDERRREHAIFNAAERWRRRGIALATVWHGAGFTGSGEVELRSQVKVEGLPDGRVHVLTANTEIGQGTSTVFTQLTVERLGVPAESVVLATPDTSRVPNSGPTVASRTVMVVGRLIERACDELKDRLGLDATATGATVTDAIKRWHDAHPGGALDAMTQYEAPPGPSWDERTYRGNAYGAYAWATYVAEVEVDLRSFLTRVIDFTAVQEVGKVLNETLARGQIQGGVAQAIGWALMEECVLRDGAMENCQLTNYAIPTADDLPSIRVAFLEHPYAYGAQGAKGIGELPMDGPAPAIASAIADALSDLGVEPTVIPITPERLSVLMPEAAHG